MSRFRELSDRMWARFGFYVAFSGTLWALTLFVVIPAIDTSELPFHAQIYLTSPVFAGMVGAWTISDLIDRASAR